MRLQFKHQAFQADAANAICDVFAGQPFSTPTYEELKPGEKFIKKCVGKRIYLAL
jgi:hypothetical protein